ncbi:hypothetical protein ACFL3S_02575 [Gemmatimonadota bacterium]
MSVGRDPEKGQRGEPEGPIGPFATWGRLYAVVLFYGVSVILLLLFLTRVLDPGTP